MQKKIPAIGILLVLAFLVLSVTGLLYLKLHSGKHSACTPLPVQSLLNRQGEKVEITTYFPHKDYLLVFFAETSPTSLSQLAELSQAVDLFPPNLVAILIHPGKMRSGLPTGTNPRLNLLIDPEGEFAQQLNVRTVPTLLLLTNDQRQVAFEERLVTAEELNKYIAKLTRDDH